jgi:hypothetical protein
MFKIFTHRVKHVLVIVLSTTLMLGWLLLSSYIDRQAIEETAHIWLIFYVLPLLIYILTDEERRD